MKRFLFLILLFGLVLVLYGCAPVSGAGQTSVSFTDVVLSGKLSVGQTFYSRNAGLEGVKVYFTPQQDGTGKIVFHLKAGAESPSDIASASLDISAIQNAGYYLFSFSPQQDSYLNNYYFLLTVEGGGQVAVGSAAGNTYDDGALYIDGNPADAQIAFKLFYDPLSMVLGLLRQGVVWMGWVIAGIFFFVLPGWALLAALWSGWNGLSWGEKAALAAGISLGIYPILILWTSLLGLHLGWVYAWLPAGAGLGYLLWRTAHNPPRLSEIRDALRRNGLPDFALLILVGLVTLARFWNVRTIQYPMWGDSYQHTIMAQLLVENNGLFNSWQPYADLITFTYHFGFHSLAAVWHWVTGMETAQALVASGQVINVLAVLALYPLALRLSRGNRWGGVVAVLVGGLLSVTPSYYTNWGRYTQLTGQVILLATIWLTWMICESPHRTWRGLALGALSWGGLALTHYRVLIMGAMYVPVIMIYTLDRNRWKSLVGKIALLTAGGGLVFLPWFVRLFGGKILHLLSFRLNTPAAAISQATTDYNAIGSLTRYMPAWLWLVVAGCIALGLWRREGRMVVLVAWWLLVFLAANPRWVGLPGDGTLTNFAVLIAVYIPAGILTGGAAGWLAETPPLRIHLRWLEWGLLAVVLICGLYGLRQRADDMDPHQYAMVTQPDLRAAAWIRENTSPDARFLVNNFFAYGGTAVVGSDGGWWLPYLAKRSTNVPPLTYSAEQGDRPNYQLWINELSQVILTQGLDDPEALSLLKERGFSYIYIGQGQGKVGNDGESFFDPALLPSNPLFRVVYHEDRVWIFKINYP